MAGKKPKAEAAKTPDPFAALRRRVSKKLEGFTADFPDDLDRWSMSGGRAKASDFPVPELALFLFRNLMRWQWSGHGEKVRWSVYGSVNGEAVGFELRKFGFTILRAGEATVPTSRITGQVKSALKDNEPNPVIAAFQRFVPGSSHQECTLGANPIIAERHELAAFARPRRAITDRRAPNYVEQRARRERLNRRATPRNRAGSKLIHAD